MKRISPLPRRAVVRTLNSTWLALSLVALSSAPAWAGKTLDAARKRGHLLCGVSSGVAGFSAPDSKGRWQGLDVDVCRAVAAAAMGSADKVKFVPLTSQQRFAALSSGQVDLLSRNTSWTLSRDAGLGFSFAAITYFDGQGFLVANKHKVTNAKQLRNAQVCVQSGTTTEKNLADFSRASGVKLKPVVYETFEAAFKAFFSGRCQVYTTDVSGLAVVRNKEAPNPSDYSILPDMISKEPLGPLVRRGDEDWLALVRWTVYALIEAEELGISRATVSARRKDANPAVKRLLGTGDDMGKPLGLDKDWAYRIIGSVGNYGEIYQRNLGKDSPLNLPRGLNRLWNQGGLMYAPPVR